jgi:class 3 adenylate cyclase
MKPAGPARVERRLAAILAADVAGYSRLIEADEEGTLARLKALRAELIDPKIAGHKGRIVKTTGDGLLVEFSSVIDALRCAAEVQAAMAKNNPPLPSDRRIEFRIGINVGDIVVEDGDIFGDGVNVAARLEGLAEPGGICVSARVREDAAGRLDPPSKTWASRRSRRSRAPFGHIEWDRGPPARRRPGRPRFHRHSRFPTSRRSRCCRSPIRAAIRSTSISSTAWSRRPSPPSSGP